jgi:hypothetical protein
VATRESSEKANPASPLQMAGWALEVKTTLMTRKEQTPLPEV